MCRNSVLRINFMRVCSPDKLEGLRRGVQLLRAMALRLSVYRFPVAHSDMSSERERRKSFSFAMSHAGTQYDTLSYADTR